MSTHHHPSGVACVACIVLGLDATPSETQAARMRLATKRRNEELLRLQTKETA